MDVERMRRLGPGRGKRRSQGKRGDGRLNHDTTLSTMGIKKGKPGTRPTYCYWA